MAHSIAFEIGIGFQVAERQGSKARGPQVRNRRRRWPRILFGVWLEAGFPFNQTGSADECHPNEAHEYHDCTATHRPATDGDGYPLRSGLGRSGILIRDAYR